MSNWVLGGLCAVGLALSGMGCRQPAAAQISGAKPGKAGHVAPPVDPVETLYTQIRDGAYQLSSALDSLATATSLAQDLAKSAGGTAAQGFKDLLGKIDDAGQELADSAEDPPSLSEFKAEFNEQDERRLNAIDSSNDALGDLADAQDIVDALLATAPPEAQPKVRQLQDDLDETVDAVETGVVALGGKLDPDPSP